MKTIHPVRAFLVGLAIAGFAWFGLTVARAAESAGGVVTMSPYEVSANSVQFRNWIKATSPHFVIYTDANPTEAMTIAREMEMLHLAAQHFFGRTALRRPPMIFVLPTSGSDWRKLEAKSAVEWKVAISDPAHNLVDFVLAQYDWQSGGLHLAWAEMGAAELYWLNLPQPLWFERGIMAYFEAAQFTHDSVTLGQGNLRVQGVLHHGWLPWRRLFEVTEADREYRGEDQFHQFAGQCIAFVQFMLTNSQPVWTDRLMTWAAMMDAGATPDEAQFKSVFEQDWKTWQKTIDRYLNGGQNLIHTLKFPPEMLKFEITQLEASPREMRALFILGQILNQNVPASPASLDALLAKELQTESFRELLIEACLKWNREAAATEHLNRLIAANSTNPTVYALAAEQRFRAEVRNLSPSARLGREDFEQIKTWCLRALAIEPRHAEANNLLALACAFAPEINEDRVKTIEAIYRTLSGNASTSTCVAALAIAHQRMGNHVGAREISRIIQESKFSDAPARAIAAALLKE